MKNSKGFTLIELIVVIAILGVLALILVPNFMGYLDDAKETAAKANVTNAYKMATATVARGYASDQGKIKLNDVIAIIKKDYSSVKINCKDIDREGNCPLIDNVSVTTSGIEATIDAKGNITTKKV